MSQVESLLRKDLEEEQRWKIPPFSLADSVTVAGLGARWGRTLEQYLEVLSHSGAPNILNYIRNTFKKQFTLVDAGCGAGVALIDMRRNFPTRGIFKGVDVRDVTQFTLKRPTTSLNVGYLFRLHKIQFHQGSIVRIREIMPQGYHAVMSVAGMYDRDNLDLQAYTIGEMYKGLRPKGIMQLQLNTTSEALETLEAQFTHERCTAVWHPAHSQVLQREALDLPGLNGTLTVIKE